MARLCERPGCSETGAVAYGMMPEHLLFWISPLADAPVDEPGVLCCRHADAMVVPRGWTLDDRREGALRLFKPRAVPAAADPPRRRTRRRNPDEPRPEQLVIDGTDELPRPELPDDLDAVDELAQVPVATSPVATSPAATSPAATSPAATSPAATSPAATSPVAHDPRAPWAPEFDHEDDLDGLLEVRSPLLARAFRGTDRPRR